MGLKSFLVSQLNNARGALPYFGVTGLVRGVLPLPLYYLKGDESISFPLLVDFNVTNRCNLACSFCYNADNHTGRRDELTLTEIEALVEECAPHRPAFFLTGGEPLVRDDLVDIVLAIKRKGMTVGLVSNGFALDEPTADALLAAGIDDVILSIHGTEEVHDAVVRRKGAFRRAMAALAYLSERLPWPGPSVNYVLSPETVPALEGFLSMVVTMPNVVVRLSHLTYVTDAERSAHARAWASRMPGWPDLLFTSMGEHQPEAFREVTRLLADERFAKVFTKPHLTEQEHEAWYSGRGMTERRCLFVWYSTLINADGTVIPCQYYGSPLGNIRTEPLADIWNGERARHLRKTLKQGLFPACARCCKS